MNSPTAFRDFAVIEAFKLAARSEDKTQLFLPKFDSGSPVHSFVDEG